MAWLLHSFAYLATITTALSLSCYICGDEGLDEFGECSTQFQYDCANYAARFPQDRIYCRTTRHKNAKNNTYTVMKECISESDHYHNFPEKGYQIDEECDLVDVDGQEVAYCLCRGDLCNKNPIAEQFMTFEERHPELFGDVEDTKPPAPPPVPSGQAPLKIAPLPQIPQSGIPSGQPLSPSGVVPQSANAFGAPQVPAPAIVPVNHPKTSSEQSEIRRSQLPARDIEKEIVNSNEKLGSRESSIQLSNLPSAPISQGAFVGQAGQTLPGRVSGQSLAVPTPPQVKPVVGSRPAGQQKQVMMHCIQCGDSNLRGEDQDCKRQVQIECLHERSMCFTRQISLAPGLFAMEKMCVLPEQLVAEFGEQAREEGCGSSNGGRVQYCACSSPACNQLSLSQQRQIFTAIESPQTKHLPELAAPELPMPISPVVDKLNVPDMPHPMPPAVPEIPEPPKNEPAPAVPSRVVPPSIVTAPPKKDPMPRPTPLPQPIVPVNHQKPAEPSAQCLVCSETDMLDPTADCSSQTQKDCVDDGSKTYCLTKQTQTSSTTFTMEKRCISESQIQSVLPEEKFIDGCATSQGGIINYCLCASSLCNAQSLLQQAQLTGVRESLEEQRIVEEEKQRQLAANTLHTNEKTHISPEQGTKTRGPPPPVVLDEDDTALETNNLDAKQNEEDILQRQREWAQADLNKSATFLSSNFVFAILSIFSFFYLF